jgi:putative oxygen-independent coproporphyrinogen III oxidase
LNNLLKLPPLSLYIHYPWCLKKCPYCDFNSHDSEVQEGYINALLRDLDEDLQYVQERKINSIFIGGGTPSLMSVKDVTDLFIGLNDRLEFSPNIEITLEANPGTFEVERFAEYRNVGINRLSIGVQSFNDEHLKFLGRIHSAKEAQNAILKAQSVGFNNINIDLMYGLKGQSIEQCISDITRAISLNPSHISFYQLTLEPNTLFFKFPPRLPGDEVLWEMGENGSRLLNQSGFHQYEVSAYSKSPSVHNLNYWEFGDYIGVGAGAHGKITKINSSEIVRTLKVKSPKDYLVSVNKNKQNSRINLVENLAFEFMLNSLRLIDGFDLKLFESRTGQSIELLKSQMKRAKKLGLLDTENHRIKPTIRGFSFLNDLQEIFLS